jgi:hypothetical protein
MSRPALDRAEAATPVVPAQPRLRIVLNLARIETVIMARSLLVLAGLVAGVVFIWALYGRGEVQPLWWDAAWETGGGQLLLAMTVLAAAQLAAGRPRRAGMADLYASFPAAAGLRTCAHLAGLAGALPASAAVIGAGAVIVEMAHPIGTPGMLVFAGGVVLVLTAGAVGTAIGTRFPHPLAGLLGAVLLFLPEATVHILPGWSVWLIPWEVLRDQLGSLPGPLISYPPAGAHVVELAGAAVLAAIIALIITSGGAWARAGLAVTAILAVAATGAAVAAQVAPVPTAQLDQLAAEMTDPGSVQHCTTEDKVRYCLYPGFGGELSAFEAPVNQVLALVPARPARPLTVRQVLIVYFTPELTHGHPQPQISQWNAQTRHAPGFAPPATTAIYIPLGGWPAGGGSLIRADFAEAMAVAGLAVGFLPTSQNVPCLALDQAREAIAIWLAIRAVHPPAGELQAGLTGHPWWAYSHGAYVQLWNYRGMFDVLWFGPPPTAAGYLLASAMSRLPAQTVTRVLADHWASWLNWHTSDAQLAAALGIAMPSVPPIPGVPAVPSPGPQNPVCTGSAA